MESWVLYSEEIALTLTIICGIGGLIQLYFALNYHLRATKKTYPSEGEKKPVSVIVCARNESENLLKNLPALLSQVHPQYEVIVVNDSSWDDTADVLKAFAQQYPTLKVIHIDEEKQQMQGKKFALTLGIKAAKHDVVLLTDADCVPCSEHWASGMSQPITEGSKIVLGISLYDYQEGWLNKLIRLDALMGALHYCGAALAGKPYMGVGRNLCYDRELFFRIGGFKSHYHVVGGDDDLFINEVTGKTKMQVANTYEYQTHSTPKQSFKAWFLQKRRHIETSSRYRTSHKIGLMLWPLSYWMIWLGWTSLFFSLNYWPAIAAVIMCRYILFLFNLHKTRAEYKTRTDLIVLFPLLELQLHLTNIALYLVNLIQKPQKWK
jgi:glycosyltransferase involved in cell wall biosynthesis